MIKVCQLGAIITHSWTALLGPLPLPLSAWVQPPGSYLLLRPPPGGTEAPGPWQGPHGFPQRSATHHNGFKIFLRIPAFWVHPEGRGLDIERTPRLCYVRTLGMSRGLPHISAVSSYRGCLFCGAPRSRTKDMEAEKQKTVQWLSPKVSQEAVWGSDLSVTEGIQVADARKQLISFLEGHWGRFSRSLPPQIPGSLPPMCTEATSPTDFFHPSVHSFIYSKEVIRAHVRNKASTGFWRHRHE